MIIDKIHEVVSFRQSKCLARYIKFDTQNTSLEEKNFQKGFYKLLKFSYNGKTIEYVRNRLKEYNKKDDEKHLKQKSNLTISGNHKFYTK